MKDAGKDAARDAVLVVDDDAAIGKVLCALLEQRGLDTTWASSGEDAVKELGARPFDLVLSDVRMPGMDGMALLDHVGARFAGVPVILLTAHGSVALAVEAMKHGSNALEGREKRGGARAATPSADLSLDSRRRESQKEALAQSGNNRTRAARMLEVSRRTLYNELREHGLE